jgi:hypothetical protein
MGTFNYKNHSTVIFGMRGSGKSAFAHTLAEGSAYRTIVYDTVSEFPERGNYHTYRPKDAYSIGEFSAFINSLKQPRKIDYDLVIIDESNRFAPPYPAKLDSAVVELNDQLRHPPFGLGVCWICRRPTQLHGDITELADQLIIFRLDGKNSLQYLEDIHVGLGKSVSGLKQYHYIVYSHGEISEHEPVNLNKKWIGCEG